METYDPCQVLIIEDDQTICDLLSRFLSKNQIEVVVAQNGDMGLVELKKKVFDCVLLDLIMPGISGFEVLRQIREVYSRIDLPVIIMTGERDKSSVLQGFDMGANDYVMKPFDLKVLLARISSQLEMKTHSETNLLNSYMSNGVQVGAQFGNFDILELLGAGGMGTVFRAKDRILDRVVALKTLLPSLELDNRQIKRFRQEAKIIANLDHPNIVKILEVGQSPQNYFTMEYVAGSSLTDYFGRTRIPVSGKLKVIAQVASALQSAHEMKVVHRDVKPSNILIDQDQTPKLLDFGTAKVLESKAELTLTVDFIGTPVYMAPEQIDSDLETVDELTDVYGLGVVLYESLTGSPPYSGSTMKVLWQISNQEPVPPRLLNASVSTELEEICLRAMSKQKARRFPSARDFEEALLSCV